jgi:hypothetical protein
MLSNEQSKGFVPVSMDTFLLPYLFLKKGESSIKQLASWLKKYADLPSIKSGIQALSDTGLAKLNNNKVALTQSGRKETEQRCGKKLDKKRLFNVVWPAMALGIDPSSKAAARLSQPSNLRGVLLAVLYELPLDRASATQVQAMSSLYIRALVGKFTGMSVNNSIKTLSKKFSDLSQTDSLRAMPIQIAVQLGLHDHETPPSVKSSDLEEFAKRTQEVTDKLTTPPLSNAVAIAQVYDSYGKIYPDAGSIDFFKSRLLEASTAKLLSLVSLDRPEAIETVLRERSEIQGQLRRFHLIRRKNVGAL